MKKTKRGSVPQKSPTSSVYACPACGSTSFDGVSGTSIEGGSPDLDIISDTIKCAQCGKEYK
jgi:Zn finger protein HypA/HybF involved in hydrogenase expression